MIPLLEAAKLGASGLCVLAVFYIAGLLKKLPGTAPKAQHITLRIYIGAVVLMAIILSIPPLVLHPSESEIAKMKHQNERYRILMSRLATTVDQKVEQEAANEGGDVRILKPSINALVKAIKAARDEHLVDK